MKKMYFFIIALIISVTTIGCANSGAPEDLIETQSQTLALEAVSSTMVLNYRESQIKEMDFAMTEMQDRPLVDQGINNIDYYIEMVEVLLGNNQLTVESVSSDNSDYTYKMIYSTKDISGNVLIFTFYYNETDLADIQQDLESNASNNHFMFNDDDDNLAIKWIQGILIFNDLSYDIEGKIIMVEGKETVRLRAYTDANNYVVVNYQMDSEPKQREKFFFKLVQDGIITNQTKVMVFNNNKMLHIQLELTEGDNYSRYQFHIRTKDDVEYIHINYVIETEENSEEGNIQLMKSLDPETNEVVYEYGLGDNTQNNNQHTNEYNKQNNHKKNHSNLFGEKQKDNENMNNNNSKK